MDNLTVVIPFYNGHDTIGHLLRDLPAELAAIVVDDVSERPFRTKRKNTTVIRLEQKGFFSGAVNTGIAACNTDVLVLNQDVRLLGVRWLEMLAEERVRHAIIGDGVFGHPAWPKGYVQGTFMFMRRDAIEQVGLLNAEWWPLWGATAEWQARACRAGFSALPLQEVPGFQHLRGEREKFGPAIRQVLRDRPELKARLIATPPRISVVISCYNYGRYLPDAISSLVGGATSLGDHPGQTYQGFEVIIVDDASQDETEEIGRSLADPWKGIRYIRLEPSLHQDGLPNNGTPAANNAGIEAAYGRHIAILGADDMMEPWRLERMLQLQEEYPHSMIYDDMMEFAHGRRTVGRRMQEYDFEHLLQQNHVHAGIMFPKTAWEEAGGYPEAMRYGREDWAFNVALGVVGVCGIRLPEPGYLYRREEQGRSTRNTTPQWRARFADQMQRLFPRIYAGERPMACCGRPNNTQPVRSGGGLNGGTSLMTASDFTGHEGMTLLRYKGNNLSQQWFGRNGRRYVFGTKKPLGLVDNRDVQLFLTKYWGDTGPLFEVVPDQPDATLNIDPDAAEAVNPPADGDTSEVETAVTGPEAVDVYDPNSGSISALKTELAKPLSLAELEAMLQLEVGGQGRKGAVDALEAAIAQLQEPAAA